MARVSLWSSDGSFLDTDETLPLTVPFGLLVWSTGICASPFVKQTTCFAKDEKNSFFLTDDRLRVLLPNAKDENDTGQVLSNVFAIGDCAQIKEKPLPATAQVASQKGKHLAFVLNGQMNDANVSSVDEHGESVFKYKNMGSLASLGRGSAIVDSPKAKAQGRVNTNFAPLLAITQAESLFLCLACLGHLEISLYIDEHVMAE